MLMPKLLLLACCRDERNFTWLQIWACNGGLVDETIGSLIAQWVPCMQARTIWVNVELGLVARECQLLRPLATETL